MTIDVPICSKLWRNKGPLEMQPLPKRLVLFCEVPKGESKLHNLSCRIDVETKAGPLNDSNVQV